MYSPRVNKLGSGSQMSKDDDKKISLEQRDVIEKVARHLEHDSRISMALQYTLKNVVFNDLDRLIFSWREKN